jgi:hypothetical protein
MRLQHENKCVGNSIIVLKYVVKSALSTWQNIRRLGRHHDRQHEGTDDSLLAETKFFIFCAYGECSGFREIFTAYVISTLCVANEIYGPL